MTGSTGPDGPDDDALGRLLAEGLERAAGDPVDDGRLLAGAHRGVERIRRRRRTGLAAATVLVLATPIGLLAGDLMPRDQATTAGAGLSSQEAPGAPEAAAPAAADTRDAAGAGSSAAGPRRSVAGPVAPTPVVPTPMSLSDKRLSTPVPSQVVVPDAALVTAGDLPAAGIRGAVVRPVSDTSYPGPVPAVPPAFRCGAVLTAGEPEALGRTAVLGPGSPPSASSWQLTSTVRVFAGSGAQGYESAASRWGCAVEVAVPGSGFGIVGRGAVDATGHTPWYAVTRVGRVVTEIQLAVPRSATVEQADVARLLRTAAGRVTSSGLAAAAQADPALR